MLLRRTSGEMASRTQSYECSASGLPVLKITSSDVRSCVCDGWCPSFSAIARNFALVPKCVSFSSAANRQRIPGSRGGIGEPSYNTIVEPSARALTSQFHIIQPQVV